MSTRLSDRLRLARRRRFVGRSAELACFRSAIAATDLPFAVLYVYGVGGVGKTTLLAEYAAFCAQAGTTAITLDGRNVEPSPDSFLDALRQAMGLEPPASPLDVLAARPQRHVLFVDTFEALTPLDGWLREVFLPQLSEHVLVVLAGRGAPSSPWQTDPGWQSLLRRQPLANLAPQDGRIYLSRRDVPAEQHQAVLDFTHGHPLALSLVADLLAQRPGTRFQPADSPDVVKTLLEQFVQKVPGPAHRAALEVCALVRLTTEGLLADILALPDVRELFDWLCSLSFVQMGQLGLFPHDLARDALSADLRWRNPDWTAELHRRARQYYAARLQKTSGLEQQRVLFDYFFLHRENPVVRPFFEWQESGSAPADHLLPSDVPPLVAMVAQHEGDDAARLAEHWLARQPEGALVFRAADQSPAGFLHMLALQRATAEDLQLDPAVQATWRYLQRHAPLRPGESATLFRFWMARDTYQGVSALQTRVFGCAAQHYLTTPGLAFAFFPCADADFWAPALGYADLARLAEADFDVGRRRYGVFGHDWRVVPPTAWLERLADRELAGAPSAGSAPPPAPVAVVLSQAEFVAALRGALRSLRQSDVLRTNPLLQSRAVTERAGASANAASRVAALQALIKEAAETLRTSPREARAYKALYHTYFQPAPTQERAAELLDWPFSTFRRYLKAGTDRIADLLWQQEIAGDRR